MNTPPRLLVVDDSRTSRMMIKKFIGDLRPDWVIEEAASGDEALVQIALSQPDFISMDVNMPGMSGLEAAGHVRLKHPDIRVVLCTANVQESVRQSAAKVGIHFVSKPITPASMADSVRYFES